MCFVCANDQQPIPTKDQQIIRINISTPTRFPAINGFSLTDPAGRSAPIFDDHSATIAFLINQFSMGMKYIPCTKAVVLH